MANTIKFGNGQWATKEDSILAYNDENANFKPLPFVTSRATTATRVNKAGLLETVASGVPRVDYLDNSKGSYLLEPSSRNLITESEAFGNSYWVKSGATVTSGFSAPSVDSPLGAFKYSTYGSSSYILGYSNCTADTEYTFSFYVKDIDFTNNALAIYDQTANSFISLDVAYTVTSEWTKITHTFTTPIGCTSVRVYPQRGTLGAGNKYIFGAQLEAQSYATSYIPNFGTVEGVTRSAETASQTLPDGIIGQTEGTIFLDTKMALQSINNYQLFSINNGGGSDRIRILTATGNRLRFIYQLDGGAYLYQFYNPTDYGSLTSLKIAFTYKSGDIKVYINGVLADSSTNTFTIAEKLINIDIATSAGGYNQMFFNDVKLYNTALTGAELAKLTKI